MPSAKKTWADKMKAKPPHQVVLEKDFAGIPKGSSCAFHLPPSLRKNCARSRPARRCRSRRGLTCKGNLKPD